LAKKKSKIPIKTIGIAGGGLAVVMLTPLLLLFAGIEVPIIGKAYADALGVQIAPQGNPDQFMLPVVDDELADELAEEIQDIVDTGSTSGQCGFEQIDPETGELPSCIGVDDGTNPPACVNTEERIEDQCFDGVPMDQIEDMIEEITDEFEEMVEEGSDLNQTQTSNDPPIEQIIDDITSATSINLILDVVKIDANNNRFSSTFLTEIPALSFFIEEESNVDFTNGFIEFSIDLQTFANTNIDGSGKLDLLIGNQTILTEPIDVRVLGTTDSDGKIDVSFVSLTGATSIAPFLFSFENNMDKFPVQGVTKIELKLIDFQVQADSTNDFALSNAVIFTMSIATNPNEIIVTDEQGELVRIFPTDDRFVIRSITSTFLARQTCVVTSSSGAGCTAQYCRTYNVPPSTRCENSALYARGTVPAPQVSGIILFENGQFVKTVVGGKNGIIFDEMLTRNTNYTITIADPPFTFDFTTPKSQKNYDYKCTGTTIGRYAVSNVLLSNPTRLISYGGVCPSMTYCLQAPYLTPFTVTGATCNFP